MARLVLALLLFAALALAATAALTLVRAWSAPRAPAVPTAPREDLMPGAVRTVSYVVLLALLLGLTSGWIGP